MKDFYVCLTVRRRNDNNLEESVELLMTSARSRSEQSSDNGDSLLECAICMDKFVDPCILPCSHTFCRHCLIQHYNFSRWTTTAQGTDENEMINCPACRQAWPLPVNVHVDQTTATEYQYNQSGINESVPPPSCGSPVAAEVP